MKFSVCGGLDAPDWILAEMLTLSTLVAVQIQALAELVIQCIVDGSFDHSEMLKLPTETSLALSDVKAAMAAVHFVITNAAKYNVSDAALSRELQQWGLPRDHSEAVCRPYWSSKQSLQAKLRQSSLTVPALAVTGWQVQGGREQGVLLQLTSEGPNGFAQPFLVSKDKFRVLLHELKAAKTLMDSFP